MNARPLVLALVGTDHHPFARLVRWADAWAAAHPDVRVVVQTGTSPAPLTAESCAYLDHGELQRLMREAAVVVSHGGPSTIAESRRLGRKPVVVPRDPAHGEHVDGHQLAFVDRLAGHDLVLRAGDGDEFARLVDAALASPASVAVDAARHVDARATACAAFDREVAALFAPGAPPRRRLPRLRGSR